MHYSHPRIGVLAPLVFCFLAGHRVIGAEHTVDARHWQLFIDDYAAARDTGFDRVVHHPQSHGIVLPADRPWETFGVQPVYVARQPDGTFVAYYAAIWCAPASGARSSSITDMEYRDGAWRRVGHPPHLPRDRAQEYVGGLAYATSKDGIHWDKPNLGLVDAPAGIDLKANAPYPSPVGVSRANNLGVQVGFADLGQYGGVTDPTRRFAVSLDGKAYFSSTPPDFLHFDQWRQRLTPANGTFSPRGHAISYWDEAHKEWVAIVQNTTTHWLPTRTIARFASPDLQHWRSEMVLAPDPADPHTPTCYDEPMMLTPFLSEGNLLGLLSWIHTDRTTPDGGPVMGPGQSVRQGWPWPLTKQNPVVWPWARKGVNEMRITLSHDGGHTWDRTSSREAWIPHGTEQDSYDRLVIFSTPALRVGDEDWFYATDYNGDHLSNRADADQGLYYHNRLRVGQGVLYTQKHDRYVSLSTGSQQETLITQPFVVQGDTLHLNVDASRGQVRVGIAEYKPVETLGKTLGADGPNRGTPSTDPYLMEQNVLPGFQMADCIPIESNSVDQVVAFKGGTSLKPIQGRTVVLFITMLDSDLYGFRTE